MKCATRAIFALPAIAAITLFFLLFHNPFVYDKHADDEAFRQSFTVTTQWQTIHLDKPLKINRKELQGLRIGLEQEKYESAVFFIARRDWEAGVRDSSQSAEGQIIRLSDEKLIRPELELVSNDGKLIRLKNTGILNGPHDTVEMEYTSYRASHWDSIPPFPDGADYFTALRIKGDEPFEVVSITWEALGID